jgi:hypothetical protein
MTRQFLRSLLTGGLVLAAAACSSDDDGEAGPDAGTTIDAKLTETPDAPPSATGSCSTAIAAGTGGDYTELCTVDGTVEHVRIAGMVNEGAHFSTQVFYGFDSPPTDPQAELVAGQFKLLFYSGMGSFVPAIVQPVYGTASGVIEADAAFVRSTATVCFDVVDSTAETAPVFNLWVDGIGGADCETAATLTADSVFASITDWGGTVGPVAKSKKVYFYQRTAAAAPTVTLFDEPVLPEGAPTEPPAPLACETAIPSGVASRYTELCSFGDTVEHVRLASIVNEGAHYSTQIFFGFDAPPAGTQDPLGPDQFKVLFYSGMGAFVPAVVQPVFGTASGVIEGDASFVRSTATVCFDLVDSTATTAPAFTLWVDGVNGADCETASTLTAEAAFASIDSWGGAVGAIAKDKKVYFYQRSAAGAPTITLFDDPVL